MKNENTIDEILIDLRQKITLSKGLLTSIDLKKLEKASKEVQTLREIDRIVNIKRTL